MDRRSDQIADVLGRDSRTVRQWQKALGKKSQSFHFALCTVIGLTLTFIQMDEIWSYLKKKKRQLWVFITLEAQTKFWVNFELGSRTGHTANRLLDKLIFIILNLLFLSYLNFAQINGYMLSYQ
jgi:hypothetical protein